MNVSQPIRALRSLAAFVLLAAVPAAAQAPAPSLEDQQESWRLKVERARDFPAAPPIFEDPLDPPEPDALSCGAPCSAGVLSRTHPYYDIFVNCASGAFTARTGVLHSVTAAALGAPQNVIYGGSGGGPGTSDVTFFVHDTGSQYTNPAGGLACEFDPPDTLNEPNSVGIEQEWQVTPTPGMDLIFRQEMVAFGDTEANSGVRLTLEIANAPTSTLSATVGLRWQIDYQNAGDDGPLYAPVICDPPSVEREINFEHEFTPAEVRDFYRIQNNSSAPIFSNVTSTTSLSGIPDTATPDRLVYGVWGSLRGSAWNYVVNEGGAGPDSDSAVLQYYGYLPADAPTLAPGTSFRRTTVIFTSADLIDCGEFVPGCAPSFGGLPPDRSICNGDTTNLDGSGLGLENCDGTIDVEWSDGMSVIGTDPVIDVAPTDNTTYTLTVTCSTDPDCLAQHEVTVTVEQPPELDDVIVGDPDPCNRGLRLGWTPGRFFDPTRSGVYNVYRSEWSCADAVLLPPVAVGLAQESWFDANTLPGIDYWYVVEAEDARTATACSPSGPNNGGAVGRFCLGPVAEAEPPARPLELGIVLFASHLGDRIDLRWDGARALEPGEHFHLLKALDQPTNAFSRANPEADLSLGFSETDRSSHLQFFDLRAANACEAESQDEFPATR